MAVSDNLIAYYKLEDEKDSKGSRDLLNPYNVEFTPAMMGNGARILPGTRLYKEDSYGMDYTSDVSLQAWVKVIIPPMGTSPSDANIFAYMFFAETPGNYVYFYYGYQSGYYKFWIAGNSIGEAYDLGTSKFNHLIITRSHVNNTVKLYVNGSLLKTSGTFTSSYAGYVSSFGIGNWFDGTFRTNSIIDEVAVWNKILSIDEITKLYNSGKGYDILSQKIPSNKNAGFFNFF